MCLCFQFLFITRLLQRIYRFIHRGCRMKRLMDLAIWVFMNTYWLACHQAWVFPGITSLVQVQYGVLHIPTSRILRQLPHPSSGGGGGGVVAVLRSVTGRGDNWVPYRPIRVNERYGRLDPAWLYTLLHQPPSAEWLCPNPLKHLRVLEGPHHHPPRNSVAQPTSMAAGKEGDVR